MILSYSISPETAPQQTFKLIPYRLLESLASVFQLNQKKEKQNNRKRRRTDARDRRESVGLNRKGNGKRSEPFRRRECRNN